MKMVLWIICAMVLSAFSITVSAADGDNAGKTLVHVVTLKFKEGTAADVIKKIQDEFRALKTKVPEVVTYMGGTNVSKEGKNKGFTHCSVLTFKSEKDLDTYVASAAHQEFVKLLKESIDDVVVVDFWE